MPWEREGYNDEDGLLISERRGPPYSYPSPILLSLFTYDLFSYDLPNPPYKADTIIRLLNKIKGVFNPLNRG